MTGTPTGHIESVLREKRLFKPKPHFGREAHIRSFAQHKKLHDESIRSPEKVCAKIAGELARFKEWSKVLS
jgi:acetyl-CoA synthetase